MVTQPKAPPATPGDEKPLVLCDWFQTICLQTKKSDKPQVPKSHFGVAKADRQGISSHKSECVVLPAGAPPCPGPPAGCGRVPARAADLAQRHLEGQQ